MKICIALILAALIVLGAVAWIARASKSGMPARPSRSVAGVPKPPPRRDIARPPAPDAGPRDSALADPRRREAQREQARARLEAEYETRVALLIASIDWTRPESRVRFPVEHDLIRQEVDLALSALKASEP